MRRRTFLTAPLLWPTLLAAAADRVAYPPVTPGRPIVLPRDHGAHPDFRTEWWYVTGALDAPEADIGFQLTFFRHRSGDAETLRSPLAARQILFAHAALTLPGDGLRHVERAARANLGASYATDDCDVAIGAWRLWRTHIGAQEVFRLGMNSAQFAYDFTLIPTQAPMLQGDDGYSRKGRAPELASYYLSWPQLRVAGTLVRDGRRQAVDGRAWFDHEWSSAILGDTAVGWDWFGINLADGGALMAFRLRDRQGTTLYAHAAWRDAAGHRRRFGTADIAFTPHRHWTSPRSGGRYPIELDIRLGDLSLSMRAIVDDQELAINQPERLIYWEGLVKLTGSLVGRGYLELTGYAGKLRL